MLDSLKVTVLAEDSVPYESPLLGQHGVSFWLEAERNGHVRRILVDVGQNPDALFFNIEHLGIPLKETDAIVITHCHYDHTRGLAKILKAIGKKDLPVIAHPSLFRLNFISEPFFRHVGVMQGDEADDLRKAGAELVLTGDPLQLMPGLSTTGEIPRVTDFEEVGISLSTISREGKVQKDFMVDDIALTAQIGGKGAVIVTGCSHAGIINILKHSLKEGERLEAVIGGFHLVEASEDRITKTVSALEAFSPSLVAAGHCTGFRAQWSLYGVFREKFATMGSGTVFQFHA
ncbi:MAG: MBL fold metallo-hydrolase [Synergistaceae bacterium]|jgi:7,8-dihydropterin-6-yl-methyl-4-(beta-D-ribofuranosyl)aminobenzene 5'-phosphate synthase|uniref:MBL fold metallo-hydrolase n=1 Tax=Aminivibrio sp. TaxID=1872489 RepID=UPI001DC0B360|nr:MBL fold metallo-hydrolase [Synergistaceae bacterium]NCC56068.1 MBL fold metallo-hydrolase [Synergistales bacterium]MDD3391490.1 MBL fold metallo-hydrolase [Synergistaceae bacterium]MDD3689692.1 MBL fold metallo-hydrolase [Synergistaceae bacterium]MDD4021013.1 MBL fold metallo-hydrolase [Synergistaceae bacterium]